MQLIQFHKSNYYLLFFIGMDILKSLTIGGLGIAFFAFILSIVAAVLRKRKFIRELLLTIAALCLISGKSI